MFKLSQASSLVSKIIEKGPGGTAKAALERGKKLYHRIRTRNAPEYNNPTDVELETIEQRLREMSIPCQDFEIVLDEYFSFVEKMNFPPEYHGGIAGGVYSEKLVEHYVAWKLLNLGTTSGGKYVDVAACGSPWAMLLRKAGVESYAIDLAISDEYRNLEYYREEDATRTTFSGSSVQSVSLQCAYEMFQQNQDVELILEIERILQPGGRAVISPLYMHTHPCFYQTPEYFGKSLGDSGSTAYLRKNCWGIPASRKYSPETFRTRVWQNAVETGLRPSVYVLRNKTELGSGVYLHFVLVLDKHK